MFWDANFWENIVINVSSGVILLIIGGIAAYFSKDKLSEFIENLIINIKNNQWMQSNQNSGSSYQFRDIQGDVNFNIEKPEVFGSITKPEEEVGPKTE